MEPYETWPDGLLGLDNRRGIVGLHEVIVDTLMMPFVTSVLGVNVTVESVDSGEGTAKEASQGCQSPPGTMESALASVHRAAVSHVVWPGAAPDCDACAEVGATGHWSEGGAARCNDDERPRRALNVRLP